MLNTTTKVILETQKYHTKLLEDILARLDELEKIRVNNIQKGNDLKNQYMDLLSKMFVSKNAPPDFIQSFKNLMNTQKR